jgi:NAD kinase
MLFVGVKDSDTLGSKAKLAETTYDRLDKALHDIDAGRYYRVNNKRMLSVIFAGQSSDVLTDVYLERQEFAGCIRYAIQVNNGQSSFNEYAIGNGVLASTSFGSAGYFSYPNRLKGKKWHQNSSVELF